METQELSHLAQMIRSRRWAALGTSVNDIPLTSMVAYAPEPDFAGFLMLLSRLSLHTQHLLDNPRTSLAVSELDSGSGNPQTLARISIQGQVEPIPPEDPRFEPLHDHYVRHLPMAEPLFGFGDFILFRLVPSEARYIGGFARAWTVSPDELRQVAALAP
jgi:heme iron utilization protein